MKEQGGETEKEGESCEGVLLSWTPPRATDKFAGPCP